LADKVVLPEHLGINPALDVAALLDAAATLPEIAGKAARQAEVEIISNVLQRTKGNKSKAAQILGVSYKTLLAKVKEYGIDASMPL
jgi:two-component system response regulator AtoC